MALLNRKCKFPPADYPEVETRSSLAFVSSKPKAKKSKWINRHRVPMKLPPLPAIHPSKRLNIPTSYGKHPS